MSDTPNIGLPLVPQGTTDPAAGLNLALIDLDVQVQTSVISMSLTAPPGSPQDGDMYVPAGPATGLWTGLEGYVVRYVTQGAFWMSFAPGTQVKLLINEADGGLYNYIPGSPGGWVPVTGGVGSIDLLTSDSPPSEIVNNATTLLIDPELIELVSVSPGVALIRGRVAVCIQLSVSDLTTDLTTGTSKAYARSPYAFTVTDVRASLIDASSSGAVQVDINDGGASILSTKLTIDATEKTSVTAATPAVISDASIADDAEITIDIDNAGTDAKGLIVTIKGVRT